jgi:peptide chain release factor subunit 1
VKEREMIYGADIDELVERKAVADSPVLSVYLDVDQSRASNLKRKFEVSLKDMLRSIESQLGENQLKSFSADARRVEQFVSDFEPKAKGLIIFSDDSENFLWVREVNAPIQNKARWSDTPYILPLLETLDEYERYGVALVDRAHARLFTVFMGEIEEHREALAPAEVRKIKTAGTDHMLSQMQFQRKADMHVLWHLKHVAEMMGKMVDRYRFDRLVLAGPVEATSELYHLLSKRLHARAVGRVALSVKASEREVLEETLKFERQVERQNENRLVEELIKDDDHRPVALGLESTLLALSEGRIWRLVYATGFNPRGGQCTNCGMLLVKTEGSCDYCNGAIEPVNDLVERIAERVLESDGKVEEVNDDATTRFEQAGGIGAFLRF